TDRVSSESLIFSLTTSAGIWIESFLQLGPASSSFTTLGRSVVLGAAVLAMIKGLRRFGYVRAAGRYEDGVSGDSADATPHPTPPEGGGRGEVYALNPANPRPDRHCSLGHFVRLSRVSTSEHGTKP